MGRHILALSLTAAVVLASCSDNPSSTSPLAPSASGSDRVTTLAGTLIDTATRSPIAGATISLGDVSTTSDASGRFHIVGGGSTGDQAATIFAPGHYERQISAMRTRAQTDPTIDLLPASPPFVFDFYRQFAHDALETTNLAPIRRWTIRPSFYIKTTIVENGASVPDNVVQTVKAILVNSVPELSNGQFTAAAVETGTETRSSKNGWVNVLFQLNISAGVIGLSSVGGNLGTMRLVYDPSNPVVFDYDPSGCTAQVYYVAEHEVTHTMGFWHAYDERNNFHSIRGGSCLGAPRTAQAKFHAAIVYSRMPGNADVDVDPLVTTSTQSLASAPATIACSIR